MNQARQDAPTPTLFTQMVVMLSTTALQQMGKLINPLSGKTEMDLEGAQAAIDMLDMLAEKTRGNLDDRENRLLTETLTALKLNFVETKEHPPQQSKEKASEPDAEPGEQAEPEIKSTGDDDEDKKKFHKSYG